MGGKVHVKSKIGEGTSFVIEITSLCKIKGKTLMKHTNQDFCSNLHQ